MDTSDKLNVGQTEILAGPDWLSGSDRIHILFITNLE